MRKIILEAKKMRNRLTVHQYLRQELGLPPYYGGNLDALYDCLTEAAEPVMVVIASKVQEAGYLGSYGRALLQVLRDAAEANDKIRVIIE